MHYLPLDAPAPTAERRMIEAEPCETCLRWSECNGVDEECPLKRDVEKEGEP